MREILDNLDKVIPDIYEFGKQSGYNNIRVFKSPLAVYKNKLLFLVSIDKAYTGTMTLENSGLFEANLNKLLKSNHCIVMQDDELDAEFKDEILNSAISLSLENIPKIKQAFGIQDVESASTKKPKLSITGQNQIVNITISFLKAESSKGEEYESTEERYIELALEYLLERQKKKQASEHQQQQGTDTAYKRKFTL